MSPGQQNFPIDNTGLNNTMTFAGSDDQVDFFPTGFKTEEELLSYIHENYQKTMATGEITLYSCARNMISNIKAFLKSRGPKELDVSESGYCKCSGWLLVGGSGSCVLAVYITLGIFQK